MLFLFQTKTWQGQGQDQQAGQDLEELDTGLDLDHTVLEDEETTLGLQCQIEGAIKDLETTLNPITVWGSLV